MRCSEGKVRLKRPGRSGVSALALGVLAVCCLSGGCAAITNPVADGLPVRRVPLELLEPSKEGEQTIPLTMLGQVPPSDYRLAPGDVLAVYVEGFLGDPPPMGPPTHVGPLVQIREQHRLAPATGYPVPVEYDGRIQLPSAGPLTVHGMSIPEAHEAIRKFYIQKQVLKEENQRVMVSLLHPRQYQVIVMRQEAANFGASAEGPFVSSKRGTGHVVDLPAYENDVLHALALTGGLPGLDAYDEVIIERNCFHGEQNAAILLRQLEDQSVGASSKIAHVGEVIRIPLRRLPGGPLCFRPEDVILQTGDVIFLEARDEEVFYTGGLLPPGVFVLPRDHDLDVIEAICRVHGSLINGAFGGSNLSGNLIAPGIGDPSPTLLAVLRRTPGGGQVSIIVDLSDALRHPEDRLIVRAGDVLILQEKPSEAFARYFTQTFLNFNFAWQAIHSKFTTGIVDVSAPDRLPGRMTQVTIPKP